MEFWCVFWGATRDFKKRYLNSFVLRTLLINSRARDDDQQNTKVDGSIKVLGAKGQLKKRPRDIKLKQF
jgi:hypothetical protein